MPIPFIIAIDGPSASGKGTIAKKLAAHFGFAHLDTGLLYRGVGMAVLNAGGDPEDEKQAVAAAIALNTAGFLLFQDWLLDPKLRYDEASIAASKVAAFPQVRASLLQFQKDFCVAADGRPGAVLDGRDIGTVIAPKANVKIFVTASSEARAGRRFKELQRRGLTTTYEEVVADMDARDKRDSERQVAPSKPASDAILLDTTPLNAEQAFEAALRIVQSRL